MTRDECRFIKPEPEPIHRILKEFNRDGFIYIGDSDHDAQACKAAGGIFVLINTRGYDMEIIKAMNPDAVIENLTELAETLKKLRAYE